MLYSGTDSAGQGQSKGHVPPSQSQSRRGLCTRRSTTCNASGRPCASVARVNLACARTGRDHEGPRPSGGAWAKKTRSKVVRRGLARTRRAPQVRRVSSPGEGTMRRVNVRKWARGRMQHAKVSCRRDHVSTLLVTRRRRKM